MAVHWVNYDLNKSGQNYDKLIEYLKSHDSWAKPVKSSFLVKTTLDAGALRDGIKARVDANDNVLVMAVSGNWASFNISADVVKWLKANL